MSTIIPFDGTQDELLTDGASELTLTFLGPLHPSEIDPEQYAGVFATLGLFNVLLVGRGIEQTMNAISLAESFGVGWETWIVNPDGSISGSSVADRPYDIPCRSLDAHEIQGDDDHGQFIRTEERYHVEVARALASARNFGPDFYDELLRYDEHLRDVLNSEQHNLVVRLKTFTLAINALSRHSTQTYLGTSPMLASPCPIGSESLLGIGLVSTAITRIRRFVERVITSVRYYDRIESLHDVPPLGEAIEGLLDSDHPVLSTDHLTAYGPPTRNVLGNQSLAHPARFANTHKMRWSQDFRFRIQSTKDAQFGHDFLPPPSENIVPLISFISARDGFRASKVSLSAPADVMTACNSSSWSLMTLTHELSHALIDDIHARIAPIDDDLEIERIFGVIEDPNTSQSLLDDISAFFYVALLKLCEKPGDESDRKITAAAFIKMLQPQWRDVLEVLTHTFDFIHFYLKKTDKYVQGVWASWAVLPNIKIRIEQYVVRTLCALHVENLGRPGGYETTYKQLQRGLRTIVGNPLVDDVLQKLDESDFKRDMLAALAASEMLVEFVAKFCTSAELRRKLELEFTDMSADPHNGDQFLMSDHQELSFTGGYVANPVRFMESMNYDKKPDAARSVWTLSMLAFEPPLAGLK